MKWALCGIAILAAFVAGTFLGQSSQQSVKPVTVKEPAKNLPADFQWEPRTESQTNLLLDGVEVGVWDWDQQAYLVKEGEGKYRWGTGCPVSPPLKINRLPTGVDSAKLSKGGEIFSANGTRVSGSEAIDLMDRAKCPNCPDPKKPNAPPSDSKGVVYFVSGSEAERKKAVTAWCQREDFKAYAEHFTFWAVEPQHWSVKDLGFGSEDRIFVQDKTRVLVHKQDNLNLDNLLAALRKVDPSVLPLKVPDLAESFCWSCLFHESSYLWPILAVAGVGLFYGVLTSIWSNGKEVE